MKFLVLMHVSRIPIFSLHVVYAFVSYLCEYVSYRDPILDLANFICFNQESGSLCINREQS
jgi:hypothetical protein